MIFSRTLYNKTLKNQRQRKILKAARENEIVIYAEMIWLSADFSVQTLVSQEKAGWYTQSAKRKNTANHKYSIYQNYPLELKDKYFPI